MKTENLKCHISVRLAKWPIMYKSMSCEMIVIYWERYWPERMFCKINSLCKREYSLLSWYQFLKQVIKLWCQILISYNSSDIINCLLLSRTVPPLPLQVYQWDICLLKSDYWYVKIHDINFKKTYMYSRFFLVWVKKISPCGYN